MVNEIIPKYAEELQEDFKDAAATFRLPYWDWAAKKQRGDSKDYDVPQIVKEPRIAVLGYDGNQTYMDNPMYKFTMPNNERMGCSGVSDMQDTGSNNTIIAVPVI
jgi:tyrosinase